VRSALRHRVAVWRNDHGVRADLPAQPGGKPIGEGIASRRCMRLALLTCALLGCAYQPGSFRYLPQNFPGQRVTVGCLDLAVERRADLSAGPAHGPVLAYQFANRCERPAIIDLAAVTVVGRTPEGAEVGLRPFDPRAELQPVALDGRSVGAEALAYLPDAPADLPLPQVCVDAATLAHQGRPHWLCFGGPAGTVVGRAP
jgi:hypothetical protein